MMRGALLAALLALVPAWMSARAAGPVDEALRARVAELHAGQDVRVDGERIAARNLIADFYRRRDFTPVWTSLERRLELLRLIESSRDDGLVPGDYHERALRAGLASAPGPAAEADRDLVFTDSLIRLAYTLYFGKLDPRQLDPEWNFARTLDGIDPVHALDEALRAPSLVQAVRVYAPQLAAYRDLERALARYRAIAASGGWQRVPGGPTLKPGMRSPRVSALRARLAATGDLPAGAASDATYFDAGLEAGLERYQRRNGLEADGLAGRRTLAALNVSAQARVDQIRVNLERIRWVAQNLKGDYLVVDIAGFHAELTLDGRAAWSSRVVVGRPYRRTPVFRATMRTIVLDPTWNVPPTILEEDVVPKLVRNPGFLAENHMQVLDFAGRAVDPAQVDWARYVGRKLPYQIVQAPGDDNPLGRLKFLFPNPHDVYLHDTPSKALFEKPERAFSSGCIRVEHPLELALLLLDDPERWNAETLRAAIATGETRVLAVKRRVPVMLLYWTAAARADGTVEFRPDLYGRDAAVLKGLEAPFRFSPPARRRARAG
jgi:murein L,D-transpeptidase YcbB/YkuD